MADPTTVGADKTLDLAGLNLWVAQQEQLMGPLVSIGDGGDATAAAFDMDQPAVVLNFAQVNLRLGQSCVVPAGRALVCDGQAYISGALMAVCVSRTIT